MFCRIFSGDIKGIDAYKVCVEADVSGGLPQFNMVGLLSSEVKEAKERVVRAFSNSGIELPARKITINLSPANIRKQGTGFDLPIAVAILTALGNIKEEKIEDKLFVGELSLDGTVNMVRGILPIALMAKEEGFKTLVVPAGNAFEGAVIDGLQISGVECLSDLIEMLNEDTLPKSDHIDLEEYLRNEYASYSIDYADIKGQEKAKRATQVAVAGFHNLMFVGPPGSGKSMLSSRIPTIQNCLSKEESLEISKIYSVLGLLNNSSLVLKRPFRSPHHSITGPALIGGQGNPKPGEITLAHKGVLFLDEATEFKKDVIEMLRQPMEDKQVSISRVWGKAIFPADFMLVMAMNPCRCGFYPDKQHCTCTKADVDRYFGKIKGPIMDRVDICVGVEKLEVQDFGKTAPGPSSAEMREAVQKAQKIQKDRFKHLNITFNSQMERNDIDKYCEISEADREILDKAYKKYNMTARGYYKVLKVARTIADMDGEARIKREHLIEAIGYRNNYGG